MSDDHARHPGLEIDISEIKGRSYTCLEGCALCCLCQPELLPEEEAKFRAAPSLAEGVAERHISPDVRGAAIKLRGAHGSCHFLNENRRCSIYHERPHFCRAFPVNVFVGWRIQFNANMSCRGLGRKGERLESIAECVLQDYGDEKLKRELKEARRVFTEFIQNTREAWVSQSFSSVRGAANALMEELTEEPGLSRLLTYAERGSTRQNASAGDLARLARKTEPEANIEERALIDGTELFDLPDLSLLPIYLGQDMRWTIFKLEGREIVGFRLSGDGSTEETSRSDPSSTELLPLTNNGRAAFKRYLSIVNLRDCFLGHAAYLCDAEGYEFNFGQVYLGALANNAVDLWWRASFLASLNGKKELGQDEVEEGIIFFDMDLLDLPTIGAFI